ncbi:hypothetical protein COV17_02020 [Candidatus Woesearchaeota archaeon CG10_big_fil_rev_8_21_14_0_10_36_11]|nr:MAG: hypothetical protein COV17_02020 [Candidatus Woesearchaeota archaeon CG10_big_fil_rev_8_21_14_0_10_36_11]
MVKKFNFACTANQGRSKPSEIFGNEHLRELDRLSEYVAISSGTSVDEIKAGIASTSFMVRTINMAYDRGDIFSSNDVDRVLAAIQGDDEAEIKDLYSQAAQRFSRDEHEYRAQVLQELGLFDRLKKGQDQTVAKPDVVAVLSMAGRNNDQVAQIHRAAGYTLARKQPDIGQIFMKDGASPVLVSVLSAYARDDPSAETPNAFGKDEIEYRETIAALREDVPRAIDRFLSGE